MFKTTLLDYQQRAVDKLIRLKIGALYMEPGTGKTRTVLDIAVTRLNKRKIDYVLWLCPCSVKSSLTMDLEKHVDDYSFIKIYGIESISMSDRIYLELLDFVQQHRVFLIVDESNLVKNWQAKRTGRIIELAKHCGYRSILNGTPVSRNEADLFAQWFILDWRVLGYKSYHSFARNHIEYDEYGNQKRVLDTEYLTTKIAPYTYQVKKSECMNLPEKQLYGSYFSLTEEQYEHMSAVGNALLYHVDEYDSTTIYRLLTCLHLVVCGYRLHLKPSKIRDDEGNMVPTVSAHNKIRFFGDFRDNPRHKRLLLLLSRIEHDEKVIIYAEYNDEINEIMQLLHETYGEGAAVQFNGDISQRQRDKQLAAFAQDARFLVANKQCAGYGLNLQHANHIIFYSLDWDWAMREQAEDRVHRLGQTREVTITDMVANGTIDNRIEKNLSRKTDLVDSLKSSIKQMKDKLIPVKLENVLEAEKEGKLLHEKVHKSKRI